MKIFLGADHNGFLLKGDLLEFLKRSDYEVVDKGDKELKPDDDFPYFASRVINAMRESSDDDPRGILICGSGQGMCMAANRFKGIRACLGYDVASVRSSRNDDDSNVLCLPAHVLKDNKAEMLVRLWLTTPFAGAPRFVRRIGEMDQLG